MLTIALCAGGEGDSYQWLKRTPILGLLNFDLRPTPKHARGGLHRHFQTLSSAPSLADDQCCAYMISMLRITELRETAMLELGPKC